MTDNMEIESLTRQLERLNIRDHLSTRRPPRSSYPANENKRTRKNSFSRNVKQRKGTGKRKKHTKKRKIKKRKSTRKK